MLDATVSAWHVVICCLQSHVGFVSLTLGALSFLATLFKPSLWRRIVFSVAVGFAGVLFGLYEPVGQFAVASRSLFLALVFIGAFWWTIGQCEKWRARKQPLPRQIAGTFETVADTVRQIVADSEDSGIESALTSQGSTLIVKKTLPHKKN
jgi:hypothetical protein